MGNTGGQQQGCAEIGFPRQLTGTRETELIRKCRPPVPYLHGDEKETVVLSRCCLLKTLTIESQQTFKA